MKSCTRSALSHHALACPARRSQYYNLYWIRYVRIFMAGTGEHGPPLSADRRRGWGWLDHAAIVVIWWVDAEVWHVAVCLYIWFLQWCTSAGWIELVCCFVGTLRWQHVLVACTTRSENDLGPLIIFTRFYISGSLRCRQIECTVYVLCVCRCGCALTILQIVFHTGHNSFHRCSSRLGQCAFDSNQTRINSGRQLSCSCDGNQLNRVRVGQQHYLAWQLAVGNV